MQAETKTPGNIDTILVHPSEEDRIREALKANGFLDIAEAVIPCSYIQQGQLMLCDSKRAMENVLFRGDI